MKRFLILLFLMCQPFVLAQGYNSFQNNFQIDNLLQQDWVIFAGVFLIVFAFVYLSLTNFFTKKEKGWAPWDSKTVIRGKGAVIVISLAIAFFVAASTVQSGIINSYLGNILANYMFVLLIAFLFLLLVPFYKTLRDSVGTIPAILLIILFFIIFLYNLLF